MDDPRKLAVARLQELQRGLKVKLGSASRGIRDLTHLPVTAGLLSDIEVCVASDDNLAIGTGLYVLKGLLIDKSFESLPQAFRSFMVSRVGQLLNHPVDSVIFDAIDWYSQLHKYYPDFRDKMLSLLASDNLGRREVALRNFKAYANPGEIEPLLRFRNDSYAGEVRPMGDWEYELRNRAFELIESQIGRKFERTLRSEPHEGTRVTWIDWAPFLEWWLANKPGRT